MLRVLQQLILSTLFAVFASQASAMFIQSDWFDPTQPGVGTNRYSYSFNDPVNMFDPNGNAAVYKDTDGDGLNEYYGQINPGDPGYNDDFSKSGILPSTWVDINSSIQGQAVPGCTGCEAGGWQGLHAFLSTQSDTTYPQSGSKPKTPIRKGRGILGALGIVAEMYSAHKKRTGEIFSTILVKRGTRKFTPRYLA